MSMYLAYFKIRGKEGKEGKEGEGREDAPTVDWAVFRFSAKS